jgi:hypothetical protein
MLKHKKQNLYWNSAIHINPDGLTVKFSWSYSPAALQPFQLVLVAHRARLSRVQVCQSFMLACRGQASDRSRSRPVMGVGTSGSPINSYQRWMTRSVNCNCSASTSPSSCRCHRLFMKATPPPIRRCARRRFLLKCSSIHSVHHSTVESIWASNGFLKKNYIFILQREKPSEQPSPSAVSWWCPCPSLNEDIKACTLLFWFHFQQ